MNPNYPIYIVSKGRWKFGLRLTSRALEEMNVPYHIVVEAQEYENYAAVIDPAKILTLPFSNLGLGSIPARNWIWEHSLATGARRHWILDDNIQHFERLNRNKKEIVHNGEIFVAAENFAGRFTNVALAGFNYRGFAPAHSAMPPYRLNTRVYSCILIKNDIPYRWEGRYNEDTHLCLQALEGGWCTVLFNAFLADKVTTGRSAGGNTELYVGDGRLKMAESLRQQHPDCTKIVWKFNRWQHSVDYSQFKNNQLLRDPNVPEGSEYGMYSESPADYALQVSRP